MITADAIGEFYTRHPYPPPVENLDRARDEWRNDLRHRAEFHLLWPDRTYRADLDILVAGCGTWQAAKYAVCRPAARVVGIDISTTSLEHTETLKRKYALANLDLRQAAIEDAGQLNRRFDLIVCTGVLHHLADPGAGLRALRSTMKPDGAMLLMVYAPYGRAGVYMLQDYCRMLGVEPSDREIHDLVATLTALPQHHPLATLLRGSRDAHHADALADALLNPRDRAYTVAQFFDLLDGNGMSLARWQWQAPYLPRCGAMAATPHAARLAALPRRHQYAAMELWRGAMTSHSAVIRRTDATGAVGGIDDDRWPRFVPVRLPWTELVLDRRPPGTAGVLLNRSHTFPDLVLGLDTGDKAMFDRIDGRRTIADIAGGAGSGLSRARALFERLFDYDQVVFDCSR